MDYGSNGSSISRFSARRMLNGYGPSVVFWGTLSITTTLMVCYLAIGDRFWWSACVVVWPSLLWCLGLVPLTLFCVSVSLRRPGRPLLLLVAVGLFLLTTVEWRSLVRSDKAEERDRFTAIRGREAVESTAIRVAVWNVNRHGIGKSEIIATLAEFTPDLCFLQETRGGTSLVHPEELVGRWEGYSWIEVGECGLLSRFPIHLVGDGGEGRTGTRQFVAVQLPRGNLVLVANVHLMKPLIAWPPFSGDRLTYRAGHARRVAQYGDLMGQIEQHSAALETQTVILAGDFNVGADMLSLAPIRDSLRDVWVTHGRGWGATALSRFPIARIDHCWVSGDIEPVSAHVIPTQVSDHRLLVVDLIVPTAALRE